MPSTIVLAGLAVLAAALSTNDDAPVPSPFRPVAQQDIAVTSESMPGTPARLVTHAQERLAELGYFDGPVDGVLSDGLRRAIEAFQKVTGQPITGRISAGLIEQIDRRYRALGMLRRLDDAKRGQIEAARESLLENPETRALLDRPGVEVADPTRDVSACLSAPDHRCLIAEALESIKAESRDYFRDWALQEILEAQTANGRIEDARDTVARMSDPRLVVKGLVTIARAQARHGVVDDAVRTARSVEGPGQAGGALIGIAEELVEAGESDRARSIAAQAVESMGTDGDPAARVDLLARAASVARRIGDSETDEALMARARNEAEAAGDGEAGAAALARLALAQVDGGSRTNALALVAQVTDPARRTPTLLHIARSDSRAGAFAEAYATVERVEEPHFRAVALVDVALADAEAGTPDRAAAAVERAAALIPEITQDFARSFARARVARAHARLAAYETALAASIEIDNPALRAETCWYLATIDGLPEAMRTAARTCAEEATDAILGALQKVWMYGDLAVLLEHEGYRQAAAEALLRALDIAADITAPWNRARAMAKIAASLGE